MELYCTRPGCHKPVNQFADLDDVSILRRTPQKYCTTCGMELILEQRYVPIKLLGQGGFGAAFLARDRRTPAMRVCVVKQFLPSDKLSPAQRQLAQTLFEREGEVLEDLGTHPQIPDLMSFFDVEVPSRIAGGRPDRFFYLVQEYINGLTLEEMQAKQGKFSEAEVRELLKQILPVLDFVHRNGSIHRDIKLSNIMRRQADGLYYLLDFGAVKQVATTGAIAGSPAGTSTGIYSPGFAPPEQMAGREVYPCSDLYALAATCVSLLTAMQPSDLRDPLYQWNWRSQAQVSTHLAQILDQMLRPDHTQRLQSAPSVLQALNRPDSPPPTPTPISPSPPTPVRSPVVHGPTAIQPQPAPSPAPSPVPAPVASPVPAPVAAPVQATRRSPANIAPFSMLELLGNAAFTGFEGGLLAIAIASLVGTLTLGAGFWVVALLGLIVAQNRRWIERIDLILIAIITLVVVLLLSPLSQALTVAPLATLVLALGGKLQAIVFLAILMGLVSMIIAILFRLVYTVLSRFF